MSGQTDVLVQTVSKSTTSLSVLLINYLSTSVTVEVDCIGIGTEYSGTLRYGTVAFPVDYLQPLAALTWNKPLSDAAYTAVCTSSSVQGTTQGDSTYAYWSNKTTSTIDVYWDAPGIDGGSVDCVAVEPGGKEVSTGSGSATSFSESTLNWEPTLLTSTYTAVCSLGLTPAALQTTNNSVVINSRGMSAVRLTFAAIGQGPTSGEADCIGAQDHKYRIVDPYAGDALSTSPGSVTLKSTDPDFIVGLQSDVVGVAADGTAHVLIILSTTGTSVTFQAPPQQGCFFSISSTPLPATCPASTSQQSVQSQAIPVSGGHAIVGYIAPLDYATSGSFTDTSTARTLQIATNGDPANTVIAMQVLRPPQFLIHGLWSGPNAWAKVKAGESGMPSFAADYSSISGSGLSATVPLVGMELQNGLIQFRTLNNVAVSQMDLIGHSMGGIIARSIADSSKYQMDDNYLQGPIHKLITVGTPFAGSPYADHLYQEFIQPNGCKLVRSVLPSLHYPIGGAIQALETTAPQIAPPDGIPMHAIIGMAGTSVEQSDQSALFFKLMQTSCVYMNLQNGYEGVFGEDSDLIVGISSQGSGFPDANKEQISGAIHTTNIPFLFPVGEPELSYIGDTTPPSLVSRLIALLNSSVQNEVFWIVKP